MELDLIEFGIWKKIPVGTACLILVSWWVCVSQPSPLEIQDFMTIAGQFLLPFPYVLPLCSLWLERCEMRWRHEFLCLTLCLSYFSPSCWWTQCQSENSLTTAYHSCCSRFTLPCHFFLHWSWSKTYIKI